MTDDIKAFKWADIESDPSITEGREFVSQDSTRKVSYYKLTERPRVDGEKPKPAGSKKK